MLVRKTSKLWNRLPSARQVSGRTCFTHGCTSFWCFCKKILTIYVRICECVGVYTIYPYRIPFLDNLPYYLFNMPWEAMGSFWMFWDCDAANFCRLIVTSGAQLHHGSTMVSKANSICQQSQLASKWWNKNHRPSPSSGWLGASHRTKPSYSAKLPSGYLTYSHGKMPYKLGF